MGCLMDPILHYNGPRCRILLDPLHETDIFQEVFQCRRIGIKSSMSGKVMFAEIGAQPIVVLA